MLRMCSRELLGNDLRRAVRDLICDENFDDGIATCLRLDFEILVLYRWRSVAQFGASGAQSV